MSDPFPVIETLVVVVLVLGLLYYAWEESANINTMIERDALVMAISHQDGDKSALWRMMDKVSHKRHMKALMCFQNPRNLYAPELRAIFPD